MRPENNASNRSKSFLLSLCLAAVLGEAVQAAPSTYVPKEDPYTFGNVKIGGGGWVTGLARSPSGVLYSRTDVGGAYRMARTGDAVKWNSITDNVLGSQEVATLGFDPRPGHEQDVYVATGSIGTPNGNSLHISTDNGKTFSTVAIAPVLADALLPNLSGNSATKNTGEKFAMLQDGTVLLGTEAGLFKTSTPRVATSWSRMASLDALTAQLEMRTGKDATSRITGQAPVSFVQVATIGGKETILVGFYAYRNGKSTVYRSIDAGATWIELAGPTYTAADLTNYPAQVKTPATATTAAVNYTPDELAGLLNKTIHSARCKVSKNGTVYVTYFADYTNAGAVWKLAPGSSSFVDATPMNTEYVTYGKRHRKLHRFCGLDVLGGATAAADTVLAGTFTAGNPQRWVAGGADGGDNVYVSISGGAKWRPQFVDGNVGGAYSIGCQYTSCFDSKPGLDAWLNKGNGAGMHNSASLAVDPQDHKRVYMTSGDGVWGTPDIHYEAPYERNLSSAGKIMAINNQDPDRAKWNSTWGFEMTGIEELVPLSFDFGANNLKLNLGFDFGMFTWTDTNQWATRVSALGMGSNYALSVAQDNRNLMMRSAGTRLLLLSRDNSATWESVVYPDQATLTVGAIEMSKDGKSVLVRNGDNKWHYGAMPTTGAAIVWTAVTLPTGIDGASLQLVPDLGDANFAYGFHRTTGTLLRSTDRGRTFAAVSIAGRMTGEGATMFGTTLASRGLTQKSTFAINSSISGLVPVPGRAGDLWISFNNIVQNGGVAAGLWRLTGLNSTDLSSFQLAWKGSAATPYDVVGRRLKGIHSAKIAFGAPKTTGGYPSLYAVGGLLWRMDPANHAVDSTLNGYFRSDDAGETWVEITDPLNRTFGGLGNAGSLFPSPTVYGEIYRGSPGRGVIYGFSKPVAVSLPSKLSGTSTAGIVSLKLTPATGLAVSSVTFKQGATVLCIDNVAPYTCDAVPPTFGTQTYTATILSGAATSSVSTSVNVAFLPKLHVGWDPSIGRYKATFQAWNSAPVTVNVHGVALGNLVRSTTCTSQPGANSCVFTGTRIPKTLQMPYVSRMSYNGANYTGTFSR